MKEKALEIVKQTVPMNDAFEELEEHEKVLLKELEAELEELKSKMTEEDLKWYYDEFGTWYAKMMAFETSVFIKPKTG